MARLAAFVVLALAAAPSALAGAACVAKDHATPEDCVAACGSRWGWPGVAMGTDRWGSVLKPSTQNMTEILHAACGLTSSAAAPSSTAPVAAGSAPPSASVTLVSSHPGTLASSSVKPTTSTQSSSSVLSSSSTHLSTSSASSFIESTHSAASVSFTPKSSSSSTPPATTSSTHHTTSTPPPPPQTSTTHTSAAATSSSGSSGSSGSGSGSGNSGSSSSGGGVTSSSDISQYLQFHNTIRAQHGASPLSWNQTLANIAQTWANKCVFQHSGGTLGPFGENLAAGTGSSYGIEAAIQSWTNEVSQYNPSSPVASHFTQVVWKASTQVGCALAECAGGTIFPSSFGTSQYYVCEYHIQGNVIGQFAQNVQV